MDQERILEVLQEFNKYADEYEEDRLSRLKPGQLAYPRSLFIEQAKRFLRQRFLLFGEAKTKVDNFLKRKELRGILEDFYDRRNEAREAKIDANKKEIDLESTYEGLKPDLEVINNYGDDILDVRPPGPMDQIEGYPRQEWEHLYNQNLKGKVLDYGPPMKRPEKKRKTIDEEYMWSP